jgi:hypothetical protein
MIIKIFLLNKSGMRIKTHIWYFFPLILYVYYIATQFSKKKFLANPHEIFMRTVLWFNVKYKIIPHAHIVELRKSDSANQKNAH